MAASDNLSPEQFPAHPGKDAWGRPLMKAYDGHGAWSCNNYDCGEHPQSLYDQKDGQPQGMPGWMAHENAPDKDMRREVDKHFAESPDMKDAEYLLNQQKP